MCLKDDKPEIMKSIEVAEFGESRLGQKGARSSPHLAKVDTKSSR